MSIGYKTILSPILHGNLFPKQYVLKDIESLAIELSETLTKATVKKEAREEIADLSWK